MGTRKSVNFNVSLEAYNKVKEIFPDAIGTEDNLLQLIEAYKFWCEHKDDVNTDNSAVITSLQAQINTLENEKMEKENECSRLQEQLNRAQSDTDTELQKALSEKKSAEEERDQYKSRLDSMAGAAPDWNSIKMRIEIFPAALLERTATRLSEYYGREITPMQVMVDMFLRYTIERNAEWFYPFMLKDADIVAIAKEINPDITDIRQIKKSLNLD